MNIKVQLKKQKKNKIILSGIKPTNKIHIGNLFGSVFEWVKLLKNNENNTAIFIVVDQHAITVDYNKNTFLEQTLAIASTYFAAGIDYKKNIVFIQSQNQDHASLSWYLTCITPIGWLERMTQYKDMQAKLQGKNVPIGTGIFMYPVLMAADILLYDTDLVPVGEDQIQHVELTRDIARRFNTKFGNILKEPNYYVNKTTARIKDLINPNKKMSKSDETGKGVVFITDSEEQIKQKIMRATTDSLNRFNYDKRNQPGLANLIDIYSYVTGLTTENIVQKYNGFGYAKFKSDLAEVLIEFLKPFQQKYKEYMSDKAELLNILKKGAERAKVISSKKLQQVKEAMGFVE